MSELMGRISGHFQASRDQLAGPIEVPEWGEGEEPLKIFYRPMTLKEQDSIFKYVTEHSLKSLAQTLIQRACDENGTKLFKPVHMTELMNSADGDVISRIVSEMTDSDEDAEKN